MRESRLVVVSNREPYTVVDDPEGGRRLQRTTGGLVSALEPVVRRSNGRWICWDPKGNGGECQVPDRGRRFTLQRVPVSAGEQHGYYEGFANRALWPLCHYSLANCHFDADDYRTYREVNRRFAAAAANGSRADELIWVQDYHLCLAPQMIRNLRQGARIGFFLHIPFPAPELFRTLPWAAELLHGMLGADLVGFHTTGYVDNFLACCSQIAGLMVDWEASRVLFRNRWVHVADFPIGIDAAAFTRTAGNEAVTRRARDLREQIGCDRLVLSVDRLDYSKGISQRLAAIERYFETHPEQIGRDHFLQVAVPSRTRVPEYQRLAREINEQVGHINGRFGTPGWNPVRCLNQDFCREELIALYRAADVALVTPIRDGMNLVCKEYCASNPDGVLVLSDLAGAADQLAADALTVSPYDVEGYARQIASALAMPGAERRRRMAALRRCVEQQDIHWWLDRFLSAARAVRGQQQDVAIDAGRFGVRWRGGPTHRPPLAPSTRAFDRSA